MRIAIIFTVLTASTLGTAAQADFVITTTPPAANLPVVAAPPKTAAPAYRSAPRFKIADGFGDRVPLYFAVRQIVPADIKVSYGPGADPHALVDWTGGQAWNRALLDAVKPLRLRLVITDTAVELRK